MISYSINVWVLMLYIRTTLINSESPNEIIKRLISKAEFECKAKVNILFLYCKPYK